MFSLFCGDMPQQHSFSLHDGEKRQNEGEQALFSLSPVAAGSQEKMREPPLKKRSFRKHLYEAISDFLTISP